MRRLACFTSAVAVLLSASTARADVSVSITPAEGSAFAQQFGLNLQELEMQLQTEIEDAFNVLRPKSYMRAISDAQAFSTKGLGVDYASSPTFLSVGVAGNVSVAFGDDGFNEPKNDQPVVGLSANVAIMGGMNLRVLSPKLRDLTVYAAGFHRKADLDDLRASISSMAVHAQYKLGRPKQVITGLFFKWGGVDLTSGFEWSRLKLGLPSGDRIPTDLPVTGASSSGEVVFNAQGLFSYQSDTLTIPFEASTSVRFLWVVTAFGGIGTDIQMGKNDMEVDLDGTLTGIEPDGTRTDLGTADVTVAEDSGPSRGKLRFFGGLQLNAAMVKAFFQVNFAPEGAVGITFGGRVAW